MSRQVLLVLVAAMGFVGCNFPETRMEPLEPRLQPAAAQPSSARAGTRQSKSQPAAAAPSG